MVLCFFFVTFPSILAPHTYNIRKESKHSLLEDINSSWTVSFGTKKRKQTFPATECLMLKIDFWLSSLSVFLLFNNHIINVGLKCHVSVSIIRLLLMFMCWTLLRENVNSVTTERWSDVSAVIHFTLRKISVLFFFVKGKHLKNSLLCCSHPHQQSLLTGASKPGFTQVS